MHLIVLCHGMWGNIHHFDYIVGQLEAKGAVSHDNGPLPPLKSDSVVVYRTSTNEGYFTYDGVDICGLRVSDEINAEISLLRRHGWQVDEISLLGYSMGGIIMRYAAGILETQGLFEAIKPRTFTTMFSPHLGVRVLGTSFGPRAFNAIGAWSMARTSRQVFLQDSHHNWHAPLFLHMTGGDTPYIKALNRFGNRTLYANVANDRRCEFYTAAAEIEDPFKGRQVDGPYIEGYAPTLLRRTSTYKYIEELPAAPTWYERAASSGLLLAKVTVALPIWFLAFLINAAYQTVLSALRTSSVVSSGRLLVHEENDQLANLLEQEANRMVENVYTAVGAQMPAVTPEIKLVYKQFNALEWTKVFVRITKDKNAHAAAIVRVDKPSFSEGKAVVRHWIDEVLQLSSGDAGTAAASATA